MTRIEVLEFTLELAEYRKFKPYLASFWTLTPDEQERVKSKHFRFNEYLKMFGELMGLYAQALVKALEVSYISGHGSALQIEPLEPILKNVTFDMKHLKV